MYHWIRLLEFFWGILRCIYLRYLRYLSFYSTNTKSLHPSSSFIPSNRPCTLDVSVRSRNSFHSSSCSYLQELTNAIKLVIPILTNTCQWGKIFHPTRITISQNHLEKWNNYSNYQYRTMWNWLNLKKKKHESMPPRLSLHTMGHIMWWLNWGMVSTSVSIPTKVTAVATVPHVVQTSTASGLVALEIVRGISMTYSIHYYTSLCRAISKRDHTPT